MHKKLVWSFLLSTIFSTSFGAPLFKNIHVINNTNYSLKILHFPEGIEESNPIAPHSHVLLKINHSYQNKKNHIEIFCVETMTYYPIYPYQHDDNYTHVINE